MNESEATQMMIQALEVLGIPYMLVGSLSSNYYGIPRSTEDADFVIQLSKTPLSAIAAHLQPQLRLDPQMFFETATGTYRNVVQLVGTPFKIELFRLSNDPHDQERFRRRQRVRLPEVETYLPTAEDVIVTKLRWALNANRSKDRDDARDVIAVQGDRLDWQYVYRWCDEHGTRELLDEVRRSIPPI